MQLHFQRLFLTCRPVDLSTCRPCRLSTCRPVDLPQAVDQFLAVDLSTADPVDPVDLSTCHVLSTKIGCRPVDRLSTDCLSTMSTCRPVDLSTAVDQLSTTVDMVDSGRTYFGPPGCRPVDLSTCRPVDLSTPVDPGCRPVDPRL